MTKKISFLILLFTLTLVTGCKKQNWLDWKAQNETWLANNLDKGWYSYRDTLLQVHQTSSGLQYAIISDKAIQEARPSVASYLTVDYQGWFINGYRFDHASHYGTSVSNVIEGWQEGLKYIHNQGDILLFIPYNLAYGDTGSGTEGTSSFIPPFSTLIFEIHICAIN